MVKNFILEGTKCSGLQFGRQYSDECIYLGYCFGSRNNIFGVLFIETTNSRWALQPLHPPNLILKNTQILETLWWQTFVWSTC